MPRSTIDPNAAGTFQTGGRPDIGHGPSFLIRALADADPETGPSLDHVIELADDDYRHDVIAGGRAARRAWRSAGAYEWRKLMDGNNFPEPGFDRHALSVIAVNLRYAPDATRAMMATDMLSPDRPAMPDLRRIADTPEKDVPVDSLIADLLARWPDSTPDRPMLLDRDHQAWRILEPISENAPAPVEGRILGLIAMFDCFEYPRRHAGRPEPRGTRPRIRPCGQVRLRRTRHGGRFRRRDRPVRTGGIHGVEGPGTVGGGKDPDRASDRATVVRAGPARGGETCRHGAPPRRPSGRRMVTGATGGRAPATLDGRMGTMPQAMLTVRGYLGANPDYLPEKTTDDGVMLPSKLQAVVYENRRVRTVDGSWADDPRGPVKTTVQLFGRAADTVHRIDMRQGDPVIAGGTLGEPSAFVSPKDGEMAGRNVINAQFLVFDSIIYQRRKDKVVQSRPSQPSMGPAGPAVGQDADGE